MTGKYALGIRVMSFYLRCISNGTAENVDRTFLSRNAVHAVINGSGMGAVGKDLLIIIIFHIME
jgi:hypothetical protein